MSTNSTIEVRMWVDKAVHPELFSHLQTLTTNRQRAERIRLLATLGMLKDGTSTKRDEQASQSVKDLAALALNL
jgi:hypothetical protein